MSSATNVDDNGPGPLGTAFKAFLFPLAGIAVEQQLPMLDFGGICPVFPHPGHVASWLAALAGLVFVHRIAFFRHPKDLEASDLRRAAALLGFALGLCCLYGAMLLPFVPLFAIGTILGIGLLGFSPFFCLYGCVIYYRMLRETCLEMKLNLAALKRPLAAGAAAAVALTLALQVPSLLEEWVVRRSLQDRGAEAHLAIGKLRLWGPGALLKRCYGAETLAVHWPVHYLFEALAPAGRPGTEACRRIFFRVTGHPFNAFPPPRIDLGMVGAGNRVSADWLVADAEVGAQAVRGRVTGLELEHSTIACRVETAAALAHVDRKMELRNDSRRQREARMRLRMPAGAVASHLSLWVNGKEEQAAFGSRAAATKAYQQVAVVQRRDPALLGTMGPDQVLLQVFPVNAGAVATVRVGFTCPLLAGTDSLQLALPAIGERNFDVVAGFRHHLVVEGARPLPVPPGTAGPSATAAGAAADALADDALLAPTRPSLRFPSAGTVPPGAAAARDADGWTVQRWSAAAPHPVRAKVILVVDGSTTMNECRPKWAELLAGWPSWAELELVVAGDELRSSPRGRPPGELAAWLECQAFEGGIDPVPALASALQARPDLVIWLHGEQPVTLSATGPLRALLENSETPLLLALPAVAGGNRVADALDGARRFLQAPRLGSLSDDLARLPLAVSADPASPDVPLDLFGPHRRSFERLSSPPALDGPRAPVRVSDDLGRLWAAGQARRNAAAGDPAKAAALAVRFRLVTPWSSAVVLETRKDYEKFDLDPSKPAAVGSIGVPEPDLWLLALLAGLLLAWTARPRGTVRPPDTARTPACAQCSTAGRDR